MDLFKYDYKSVINYILEKYEIGETFWILTGLEIVGIKNAKFWLDFVEHIKESDFFESLPTYVLIMKKILRNDLLISLDNILESDEFKTSEEIYLAFSDMLIKIFEEQEKVKILKKE